MRNGDIMEAGTIANANANDTSPGDDMDIENRKTKLNNQKKSRVLCLAVS